MTKDAFTSFARTYNWAIDKWADQSALTLAIGETGTVYYSVAVNMLGPTDSNWAVNGNIAVYNPAPVQATINGVSDIVSGGIGATVDCGVSFPYTLAGYGTLNCTYNASLPDASFRTNTATATRQNYSYDYLMNPTPVGTTDISSAPANVDFSNATINEVDECANVSDSFAGNLGMVCSSQTFPYIRTIGPYDVCGDYTVENTASFNTNDTGVTGSDAWTVRCHRAVPAGV
ncbi:MAG: hypothetical protein M5R40_13030 [Anaerolineae bacterium]|nr:hypothetical protein [Anaerolineae bacterium]